MNDMWITAGTSVLTTVLAGGGLAILIERWRKGARTDVFAQMQVVSTALMNQLREAANEAQVDAEETRKQAAEARREASDARREAETAYKNLVQVSRTADRLMAKLELIAEMIHDPSLDSTDVLVRLKRMVPHPGGANGKGLT